MTKGKKEKGRGCIGTRGGKGEDGRAGEKIGPKAKKETGNRGEAAVTSILI